MVRKSLEVAAKLAEEGISIEIVDPRTVSPLDTNAILHSVAKTGRVLVIDEAFGPCGIGSEIAAAIAERAFDELDAPPKRLSGAFAPTPYSPPLEAAVVPQLEDIESAIRELMDE